GAPECPSDPADAGGGEQDGAVRGLFQGGQQGLGEQEGGVDVDLHDLLPCAGLVVGDGGALAQLAGIVEQAVEAAEFRHEGVGDRLVVRLAGPGQVQGLDHRLRQPGGDDAVVDRLQLGGGAPGEDHRGAVTGVGEARGAADAVAGAGDQDDAPRQQVGGGPV